MRHLPLMALIFSVVFVVNCQQKKPEQVTVTKTVPKIRSVYFDYDESLVRDDMGTVLQGNAENIKTKDVSATLEGHADSRGSNEYNLALAQRRAQATKNYLINLGVNGTKLRTISYGESKPVCTESSEDCWWKNRRVDFRTN